MVERTVAAFGRIDTLVNNAGATMWARFEDIDDMAILARIMQVNYMGAVYCTHYALPHLKASRGRLVGIASLTALVGVPTRSGYAASKHAMRGFFDSLRIELADSRRDGDDDLPRLRLHRHPRERHRTRRQAHRGEPGEGGRGDERRGVRPHHASGPSRRGGGRWS